MVYPELGAFGSEEWGARLGQMDERPDGGKAERRDLHG